MYVSPPTTSYSCDGFAVVTLNAGVSPFTYQWTDLSGNSVSTTDLAPGLCNEVYFVSVTDNLGCVLLDTIFSGTIMGCTNPLALNYIWASNMDDGSCIYDG